VRTRNAYRFRIYPSEEQRRILEQTLQTCRILYNNLLAERRDTYREIGRSASYYEQKRGLTKRRNANPYLPQVHSQVLQDVADRIMRRIEKGEFGQVMTIMGRAQAPVFRHGVSEPLQLKCLAQTGSAGPNETIPEGTVGSDVVEMSEASNEAPNRK
jgi:putative transposase